MRSRGSFNSRHGSRREGVVAAQREEQTGGSTNGKKSSEQRSGAKGLVRWTSECPHLLSFALISVHSFSMTVTPLSFICSFLCNHIWILSVHVCAPILCLYLSLGPFLPSLRLCLHLWLALSLSSSGVLSSSSPSVSPSLALSLNSPLPTSVYLPL